MGWVCSPSDDNCLISFYSISEDIKIVSDAIFGFIGGLSPGLLSMIFIITIGIMGMVILFSVRKALRTIASNQ